MTPDYVTRYVMTYINRDGTRQLADAAQGRYTYATPEEAQQNIDALFANNPRDRIASIWGEQAIGTFEVRPCRCYQGHFDPVGIYFDVKGED